MPMAIDVYAAEGLAVARCDGEVLEAEIYAAIDFSFVDRMPPGMDRVVYIEPMADLRALDAEALHRIQAHVFRKSGSNGVRPFRSVLVTPSPFHRPIAELYKAIWDSHQVPGLEFTVVTTPADAARLLGLPRGPALLMRLPPGHAGERR